HFNYSQLDQRVDRLVALLRDSGVEHGERVLWLGQNSFRLLELLLACGRLGAICCPANSRWTPHEIGAVLAVLQPLAVVWQEAELGEVNRQAREHSPSGIRWICHDSEQYGASYEALLQQAAPAAELASPAPGTPLLAIYTAGFSGRPGAALLSHESLTIVA